MSLTTPADAKGSISHLVKCDATHLVVMGVSGCGKTSLGTELATQLDWPFFDADDFHPTQNVAKMRAGQPLDDEDRAPWLLRLSELLHVNPHAVLACSALKTRYREVLQAGLPHLRFIHPHGKFDVIAARIEARSRETGHYMPASLLQSQFEALEPCDTAIAVDIEMPRSERSSFVLAQLQTC